MCFGDFVFFLYKVPVDIYQEMNIGIYRKGADANIFSLPSERLINGWDTNICAPLLSGAFLYIGDKLNTGNFYFMKDEYYKRFPNCGLMGNKDSDEAGTHGKPCFYYFEMDGYFWMVPISSKTEKYMALYEKKRYREYDGLRFGYVNGTYRAFLIQNVCPVSEEYIDCQSMFEHSFPPSARPTLRYI